MEEYEVTVNAQYGTETWRQNGKIHRVGGPAITYADGDAAWYRNGKLHREDGPAFSSATGYEAWYQNGKLHRLDGPAITHISGYKCWYQNDLKHREDGPAIEWADDERNWYIKGEELTEQEFLNRDKVEVTIDGVTMFISKESAESVIKCITPVDSKNKCMTCKNNARLGFGNVFPLCIITSFKIVNPVFECEHYKE